jgi:glutathione peroxidase
MAVKTVFDFEAKRLSGESVALSQYRGKVLVIVNTASACGLTPQYKDLQTLYERYRERGVEVLGFPCNQFGAQEPGSAEEIQTFCTHNYGVTFPMFAKIDVNGVGAHPLFEYLKNHAPGMMEGAPIEWNFTKFLVAKSGAVYGRYAPTSLPNEMLRDIEIALAE